MLFLWRALTGNKFVTKLRIIVCIATYTIHYCRETFWMLGTSQALEVANLNSVNYKWIVVNPSKCSCTLTLTVVPVNLCPSTIHFSQSNNCIYFCVCNCDKNKGSLVVLSTNTMYLSLNRRLQLWLW